MKRQLCNRFQSWMNAITFAEAGEWNTAEEMIPATRLSNKIGAFTRIFCAAAFAEEGMHEYAVKFAEGKEQQMKKSFKKDLADLGIGRIHLRYGRVSS